MVVVVGEMVVVRMMRSGKQKQKEELYEAWKSSIFVTEDSIACLGDGDSLDRFRVS